MTRDLPARRAWLLAAPMLLGACGCAEPDPGPAEASSPSVARAQPSGLAPSTTVEPSTPRAPAPAVADDAAAAEAETKAETEAEAETETFDPSVPPAVQIPKQVPPRTPESIPKPDPEAAVRERALTDIGKHALESLRKGDYDAFVAVTPLGRGGLETVCPDFARSVDRRELEARFAYCHRQIDWATVTDVRVGGGEPSGRPAEGCAEGVEDFGRLQMVVHLPSARWQVDFYGAIGRAGQLIGVDGAVSCRKL